MSKHHKTLVTDEGLDAEDIIAIARDREADRKRGELNEFGYCCDCGLGPFSPGIYHCRACDQEDF